MHTSPLISKTDSLFLCVCYLSNVSLTLARQPAAPLAPLSLSVSALSTCSLPRQLSALTLRTTSHLCCHHFPQKPSCLNIGSGSRVMVWIVWWLLLSYRRDSRKCYRFVQITTQTTRVPFQIQKLADCFFFSVFKHRECLGTSVLRIQFCRCFLFSVQTIHAWCSIWAQQSLFPCCLRRSGMQPEESRGALCQY